MYMCMRVCGVREVVDLPVAMRKTEAVYKASAAQCERKW